MRAMHATHTGVQQFFCVCKIRNTGCYNAVKTSDFENCVLHHMFGKVLQLLKVIFFYSKCIRKRLAIGLCPELHGELGVAERGGIIPFTTNFWIRH